MDFSLRLDTGDGIFYAGLFYLLAVLVNYSYNYWYYLQERKRSKEYINSESQTLAARVKKLEDLIS